MEPRPKGKLAPLQEVPLYTPPVLQTTSLSNEGTAKRPNRLNPIEKLKPLNPEALTSASTPTPTPTRSKRLNPLVNRELTLKNSDQGLTDSLAVSSPHTSALNSSNDSMSLNSPTLSENEKYRRAVAYFKANPSVEKWRKSESGLGESWCHSKDGTVFKLTSHVVGKGSFGKVKYSEFEESVVKVCVLKKEKALQAIIKEAAIAQTLGIATSDLIIRRTTNALGESIIKTYQRMNYLGKSLEDTLKGEKASNWKGGKCNNV